MHHLISTLLALCLLSASAFAQTIKTLGFNTTNGQVVANTGTNTLTFTNPISISYEGNTITYNAFGLNGWGDNFNFEENFLRGETFNVFSWNVDNTNTAAFILGIPLAFNENFENIVQISRANLGFSTNLNTLWTATNASNARAAVGLGTADSVQFDEVFSQSFEATDGGTNYIRFNTEGFTFGNSSLSAQTRSSLSLGLPALTNTSNVTMMRALAGSTNTNQPYTGNIEIKNHANDNYYLDVQNGIILNVRPE